MSLGFHIEMN